MGKQRLSDGIDVHYGEYAISGTTVIDSNRNLTNIGTIGSGAITSSGLVKISMAQSSGSPILDLHNSTNAANVEIRFTDVAAGTSQFGHIRYNHADSNSYGSGASFTIGSDQSTTTILADGKLMFNEGLYVKPSSGTGAGTQVISSARALQNIVSLDSTTTTTIQNAVEGTGLNADTLDGVEASEFLRSNTSDSASGTLTFSGVQIYQGATFWRVSSSDTAVQRADARDDDTDKARLHWYGVTASDGTSNFRHAWYDGNSYVDVTAENDGASFGGHLNIASGYHYKVNGTAVINASRQLVNIDTISCGAITSSGDFDQGGTNDRHFVTSAHDLGSGDLNTMWSTNVAYNKSGGIQPFRYQDGASNKPVSGNNANWGLNIYSHPGSTSSNNPYGVQLAGADSDTKLLYIRKFGNGVAGSWYQIPVGGNVANPINLKVTGTMTANNGFTVDGTTVINSSRVLQNVTADASILTGTIADARMSGTYTMDISGTATHANNLNATDDRDIAPEDLTYNDDLRIYFADKNRVEGGSSGSTWLDFLVLNSYSDSSGGDANALAFGKTSQNLYHYFADQTATNWGTPKQIAYTDSNISGTSAGLSGTPNITVGTISSGRVTTSEDLRMTGNAYLRSDNIFSFLTISGSAQVGKFKGVAAQTSYASNTPSDGMFLALNGYAVGTGSGTTVIDSSRNFLNMETINSKGFWTTSSAISHWGSGSGNGGTAYGTLTWDSGYASIYGTSGNELRLGSNGSQGRMVITTAGNVTFTGDLYPSGSTSTHIEVNNPYVQINTASGYTRIGAGNSSYSHFYTDRSDYYFNVGITVDTGVVQSYNEDLVLRRAGSSSTQIIVGSTSVELGNGIDTFYGKGAGTGTKIYRADGVFFTWDSPNYGTNIQHSIRSTYGDTYGDEITLNSYNHFRVNIDSNNNDATSYFEVGHHTTGTANILMRLTSPSGDFEVDGNVTAYSTSISDAKYKDNVTPLENSLEKVLQLRGVEFDWNATSRKGRHDIGFIAQEVEPIIPEVVTEVLNGVGEFSQKEEKSKTIAYDKLVPLLVEAIKEQQKEIEELKKHSHPAKDMCDMNGYEELVARIEKMEKNYGNN